jgi:hypothetical protein
VTQQHRDPPPVAGVHLVKTTSREEDSLASDVVDLLQEATRGGTDTDVGGVEGTYLTTLERDEMQRIEHEFFQKLAHRVRERCPWTDGRRGLGVNELGDRDGWRFSVYDRDGRPFEVEISFSHIAQIASEQRKSTFGNFHRVLDNICDGLRDARVRYFARRDAVELH